MNYIRIDEPQVAPLGLFYFLYPIYEDEEEPDFEDTLLFSQPFNSYDDACTFAMQVLKSPELSALKWNYEHPDFMQIDAEYLNRLKKLSEVEMFQELWVFNDKWEVVDCPDNYSRYVGKVFKDDLDKEQQEKPDPEKIYS